MMRKHLVLRALCSSPLALTVLLATTSCGDVVRNGRAPVILVINSLQGAHGNTPTNLSGFLNSDVITNLTTPPPCTTNTPCPTIFNDVGQAVLSLALKDVGTTAAPTAASSNNQVTINRVHIEYTRADGRNTPGVDVPFAFDGAVTGTVPASGTFNLSFELVRHVAKEESPLVQLQSSPVIITTIARVTFYGTDLVGNEISATGTIQIDFGNFGDTQ
ncbi:MAG TPA: hypothetical protein VFA59_14855 [Vicinamibacterales bacterium]|nr:hypothetical protein [Vicinamibacterales bacterium]